MICFRGLVLQAVQVVATEEAEVGHLDPQFAYEALQCHDKKTLHPVYNSPTHDMISVNRRPSV